MQKTSDAINFFIETCTPPLSVIDLTNAGAAPPPPRPGMLSPSDFANVGAVPLKWTPKLGPWIAEVKV